MKPTNELQEIGIVVPTLGERDVYLFECLKSIREAGNAYICVVAPSSVNITRCLDEGLIDQVVTDPRRGLPAAIDLAFSELPKEIKYINWLGDDDRLVPGSLEMALGALDKNKCDFVFGSCDYIDSKGELIGTNRSGSWAMKLLRYGPDLVPQPGSLFRRDSFNAVGGLDSSLGWAFDLDLFLRFGKSIRWKYVSTTLAQYRWHEETLSTGRRREMIGEARRVRRRYLNKVQVLFSPLWEWPLSIAVNFAGKFVTWYSVYRARRQHRNGESK
jgi:hypothetical protein